MKPVTWKFSQQAPWYDLPPKYPSRQTCYRHYLRWKKTGVLDQVYRLLYIDLRDRGGLDLVKAVSEDKIQISRQGSHWNLTFPSDLAGTWQVSLARLLLIRLLKDAWQLILQYSIPDR